MKTFAGADYALGVGGYPKYDSDVLYIGVNQYFNPYVGIKYVAPDKYVTVKLMLGYSFWLTPSPEVHIIGGGSIPKKDYDQLAGYMSGGVMVSLSLGVNFFERQRK